MYSPSKYNITDKGNCVNNNGTMSDITAIKSGLNKPKCTIH